MNFIVSTSIIKYIKKGRKERVHLVKFEKYFGFWVLKIVKLRVDFVGSHLKKKKIENWFDKILGVFCK